MPKVTIRREKTKFSAAAASLEVKLDRKKVLLKNGEHITIELKPGKHKLVIQRTFLARFVGALMHQQAVNLVYKFKQAQGEDIVVDCGMTGNKIWYEAYDAANAPVVEEYNPMKGHGGAKSGS
ncbi:MAG TPA: hypothetical protein PLF13_03250 [candidate division Zixibacteria bacterium]|nr:hypothetical protein [candidate division Zixibacteria bacterium]